MQTLFGRAMVLLFEAPRPSSFNNPLLNANQAGADTSAKAYAFGASSILSPTAVNSLRFSINRPDIVRRTWPAFDPTDVGINAFSHNKGYMLTLVSGAFNVGAAHLSADSIFDGHTATIEDNLSFIRGRHQFGLGGSLTHAKSHTVLSTSVNPTYSFSGQVTGLGIGDFMLGRAASMVQGSPADVVQTWCRRSGSRRCMHRTPGR